MQRIQLEKVFIEVLSYFGVRKAEGHLAEQLTSMCSQGRRRKCPWDYQKLKIWRPENWAQVLDVSKHGQDYGLLATIWTMDTEELCTLGSVFGSSIL